MKKLTKLNLLLIIIAAVSVFAAAIMFLGSFSNRSDMKPDAVAMWTPEENIDKEALQLQSLEKSLQKTLSELDGVTRCVVSIGEDLVLNQKTVFIIIDTQSKEKISKQTDSITKLVQGTDSDIEQENVYIHVNETS